MEGAAKLGTTNKLAFLHRELLALWIGNCMLFVQVELMSISTQFKN